MLGLVFTDVLWILLYIAATTMVPAIVVFFATFFAGLGFYLRDLKYDLSKRFRKKTPDPVGQDSR